MVDCENVCIFANTSAEISKEYISKFNEPDIVFNYLQQLTQKSSVELSCRKGAYQVSGTWLSVNKVHSFLGRFLLSYGQSFVASASPEPQEDEHPYEEEPEVHFENTTNVVEELPPCENKGLTAKTPAKPTIVKSSKMTPEPVVLYAGYKASAKHAESRRKTLEVLKNVYKMEQSYQAALKASREFGLRNFSQRENQHIPPGEESADILNSADHENSEFASNSYNDGAQRQQEILDPWSSEVGDNQEMSKFKESGLTDAIGKGRLSSLSKSLTEEETAAKRKKVESIAENILSNVPYIETVNVVSKKIKDVESANEKTDEAVNSNNENEMITSKDESCVNDLNSDAGDDDVDELSVDKDYPDSENEEDDDNEEEGDEKRSSDNEYIPDDEDVIPQEPSKKMSTRLRNKCIKSESLIESLPVKRGRPRKGFPMKIDLDNFQSSTEHAEGESPHKKKRGSKVKGRRGRPPKSETKPLEMKEYQCGSCSYVTHKQSSLNEHEKRAHCVKAFTCGQCGKIFGYRKDLRRHEKTHKEPENCCDICGKLYKFVKSLAEHCKTHEVGYVKPEFECEICKKSFSTKYVLAYHIKSEHLGMKRTFVCPTCGKSFSQKNSYIQHANVHIGFKPYKCDICNKAFSYEKSLKEHKFMHDDLRRFKCTVCDKAFRQSSAVAIHMKVHKETKDYVCMACGKGFSQKQALIRHERIHLGEKPFLCCLCRRDFTDSSILRRHMILIHKKDPKNWREDTVNNTVRRKDFFIDVLPDALEDNQTPVETINPVEHTFNEENNVSAINPASTVTTEPINMTTQGISVIRDRLNIAQVVQSVFSKEDQTVDHPYSLTMAQIQHASDNVLPGMPENRIHMLDHKLPANVHPDTDLLQNHDQDLQTPLSHKVDGYASGVLPTHTISSYAMGQSNYAYTPQMVMMQEPYPPQTGANYQTQFTDTGTSNSYYGYHPSQLD